MMLKLRNIYPVLFLLVVGVQGYSQDKAVSDDKPYLVKRFDEMIRNSSVIVCAVLKHPAIYVETQKITYEYGSIDVDLLKSSFRIISSILNPTKHIKISLESVAPEKPINFPGNYFFPKLDKSNDVYLLFLKDNVNRKDVFQPAFFSKWGQGYAIVNLKDGSDSMVLLKEVLGYKSPLYQNISSLIDKENSIDKDKLAEIEKRLLSIRNEVDESLGNKAKGE